jgi:hypothetical protein
MTWIDKEDGDIIYASDINMIYHRGDEVLEQATTAKTAAQTAQGLSEGARDDAVDAKDQAVLAKTAAETAQGFAETAATSANTAKAGAESARDTAITAKGDAITAKTAAQTAQTGAETAQVAAESARTAAETAQTGAMTARTAAETAETSAETAQGAAQAAQTAAETAKVASQAAQAGAETARTAAEAARDEAVGTVESKAFKLVGITITTPPDKVSYQETETFDPTGMVVTATYANGTSYAVTDYKFAPKGALYPTDTAVTISYQEGGIIKTAVQAITVNGIIYGVSWDGTATTAWSRTDASASFADPVPYVAGATSYGSPFDGLMPWAGMVKSNRTGGVMVSIPKFWFKWTQNGNGLALQIADFAAEGFSVSPVHMDRGDGAGERDVVYIGRFHCGENDYKSVTGVLPKVNITRSAARTAIHALGSTIWQTDYAERLTLQMLYLVEYADWNSQTKIGYGCGDGSAKSNMGYTDSMPYHTGTTAASRTTYGGTQYRWIEGLWDNVLDWMDGCYYGSGGMYVIENPASFSDSANGTAIGTPSSGYPTVMSISSVSGFEWAMYPTTESGSNTTYVPDVWYFGASNPCLFVGGYYGQNLSRGLFFVSCAGVSVADSSIGCRLLELP